MSAGLVEGVDELEHRQRGGKYAGGTLNAASFAADRNSASTMRQLSFFRNRFYDQSTGRWTQEDPIGVAGGLNLYQFNGNNPVTFSDPFGLCVPPDSPVCKFITGVADRVRPLESLQPAMLAIASLPTIGVGGAAPTLLRLASGARAASAIPTATNVALSNTIRALFQSGDEIAGGTAGAIRNEALTGQATGGVFHLQKGIERITNLERIVGREPLSATDRQTAERLLSGLRDAVRFAREQAER